MIGRLEMWNLVIDYWPSQVPNHADAAVLFFPHKDTKFLSRAGLAGSLRVILEINL